MARRTLTLWSVANAAAIITITMPTISLAPVGDTRPSASHGDPDRLASHTAISAIAQGRHRFCAMTETTCAGEADFVMIWRERDGQWQVTRVLSYGHRAAP